MQFREKNRAFWNFRVFIFMKSWHEAMHKLHKEMDANNQPENLDKNLWAKGDTTHHGRP